MRIPPEAHKSRPNNPGRSISNRSLHAPKPLIVNSWSGSHINLRFSSSPSGKSNKWGAQNERFASINQSAQRQQCEKSSEQKAFEEAFYDPGGSENKWVSYLRSTEEDDTSKGDKSSDENCFAIFLHSRHFTTHLSHVSLINTTRCDNCASVSDGGKLSIFDSLVLATMKQMWHRRSLPN